MTSRSSPGRAASPLPALCARPELHALVAQELAAAAAEVADWDATLRLAEQHNLSPLLYYHLNSTGISLSTPVKRELLAEFLQSARTNDLRAAALVEMLAALETRGIHAMVLKGAALMHTVYPLPGLRPMRDLDLLVSPDNLTPTREVLLGLGYREERQTFTPADHHHLPPLARWQNGMQVSVEIHHQIFPSTRHYRPLQYQELVGSKPFSFQIKGVTAYTLSLEDTLWHIYRHAAGPPLLTIPLKLIYVADIVGLVEKYAHQIDWDLLQHRYPQVPRILPLLHYLTPWSPEILERFNWNLFPAPAGAGEEFDGWPRRSLREATLAGTFAPPEWWLRLFYGVGMASSGSYAWHRWVRHPFHVVEWAVSSTLATLRK